MILSSSAFRAGGAIPRRFTSNGENISPPLKWTGAPLNAKSFTLLCLDEDFNGRTRYHWAAYDIPTYHCDLAEGAGKPGPFEDFRHAVNEFEHFGYGGPRPTDRRGVHNYGFYIYALDCESLSVRTHPRCEEVLNEARRHALGTAKLVGTYDWR